MIRQFHPEDASACSALIRNCLERDPAYPSALLQKLLSSETAQAMNERAKLFYIAVCEMDSGVVGIGGLEMNEIRLLYVSAGHRHQGIGRTLLRHLKAMVPSALFSDIFVYSTEHSVAFYRACGFVDRGPCTFCLEGQELQTVFLTCPLPKERFM